LRELERNDEQERLLAMKNENDDDLHSESAMTGITVLPNGQKLLSYNVFLQNQRYYDDLKHVDCRYIDFGTFFSEHYHHDGNSKKITTSPLIIEQDKSLGKGGLCWDAAFILGEYLIETFHSWNNERMESPSTTSIIELGCGTGLCGLMIAKAPGILSDDCHVALTDLPKLMPLLRRNVHRNCGKTMIADDNNTETLLHEYLQAQLKISFHKDNDDLLVIGYQPSSSPYCAKSTTTDSNCVCQNVTASVLDWGRDDDIKAVGTFDVVVGADVVASLYDPTALAHTIYHLSHDDTTVFISFKERLSAVHRQFENRMQQLFEDVHIGPPIVLQTKNDGGVTTTWHSRNRNPDIQILTARNKKTGVLHIVK
jgi:hypothetical protein